MSFPKIRITDAGKVMVANALAGTGDSIKFTRFKVGSGTTPSDETQWDAYTDLVQTQLSVNFTDYIRNNDLITLTGEFANAAVQTAFFWTELGIYGVQVDSSANEGEETLIFYGNAGSLAEYIPAADAEVSVQHSWSTMLAISSAADVSAVVHTITYATAADLNAHITNANGQNPNPHGVTYEQTGAAPKDHASVTAEYGKGSGSNFGHVKLSNSTVSESGVNDGIAATPAAVHSVKQAAQSAQHAAEQAQEEALLRGYPTEYGTYTGNGSRDRTLTFTRGVPKLLLLFLHPATGSTTADEIAVAFILPRAGMGFTVYNPRNNGGDYVKLEVTTSGNSVKFSARDYNYYTGSPQYGMNLNGRSYSYVAIM